MRVVSRKTLREFWQQPDYKDAEKPLTAWYNLTLRAHWSSPADLKAQFGNASVLKNGRVVFNIAGNKYRLVVRIEYAYEIVFIRFIGTHGQYDQINAEEV
ncbi:MAG: type II toxin-antitoxin system HigB family toxin [Deltaproteobacteria bacterium]|nr:type II toxin-antitoxin system HigB family toxin [Deltaproteobacteria bacterium]